MKENYEMSKRSFSFLTKVKTQKTKSLFSKKDKKIRRHSVFLNSAFSSSHSKVNKELLKTKKTKIINRKSLNINNNNINLYTPMHQGNIEEEFNLDQLGRIEYAKQHSSANRPLNKLEEFGSDQVFCKCCGLPCITKGVIEPFKMCDNTDKYSVLGQAISLYFSFYKFTIFILFILLCALILPSFYMIQFYYFSLSDICNKDFNNSINFYKCESFITDKEYLKKNNRENSDIFFSQFNAANLITYIELYDILMNNNSFPAQNNESPHNNYNIQKIKKLSVNNSFVYFIVLISLFIINLIYIVFQNNKILEYNFQLISPSDYAVIMTNMFQVYKSFRKMKYTYLNSVRVSSLKNYWRKLGFSEKEIINNNITEDMEFGAFIKNLINQNEKYNIQLVNICYKLDKFKELEDKINYYKKELFKIDNNPRQIRRNKFFNLSGNKRHYFKSTFPGIKYFNLKSHCCEKKIPLIEIIRKKKLKENQLNNLLESSKNIKKENFANVAVISFNSIDEQEKFLSKYSKNLFSTFLSNLKFFIYYLCLCLLSKEFKSKLEKENRELVSMAPEPDDIIFENLEITKRKRFLFILGSTSISFIVIVVSFNIVVILTLAQKKIDNLPFGAQKISRFIMSLGMTGVISLVNVIFQGMLEKLTKLERHMSITDHTLSFSVKLTLFTFANSAIVPLISIVKIGDDPNYELLINNIFMIFLVNSFVSPVMWTFNVGFCLKKWKIWNLENKQNANMRHNMSQKELNELYEYADIDLAYKYSYISKTLLMTFFYLPLFPFGIVFSICGLILGFYLEKFNIGHTYKRPEMLNEAICKFYVNYYEINFLMLAVGDFIFLKDNYNINYWQYITLIFFLLSLIIPYGQYLSFNLIGISQSQIINENYNDAYFTFYIDYERMNPFTRKIGTINYLIRLKEKDYISEEEFQNMKKQIESLNFMQIISLAKKNKNGKTKKILLNRPLLNRIEFGESDINAKRLLTLVNKLYIMSIIEEDIDKKKKKKVHFKKPFKIPNILRLVGRIFGTEEEKEVDINIDKDENNNPIIIVEEDKNSVIIPEFKKRPVPFVFDLNKKNKNINKDISNNISINNKSNKINGNKKDIIKKADFLSNQILNQIKKEINERKISVKSSENKQIYNKENINKNKINIMKNIFNISHSKNNDIPNDVIINSNDENNASSSNSNKTKKSMLSTVSDMINKFFDKFKNRAKDDTVNSERYRLEN